MFSNTNLIITGGTFTQENRSDVAYRGGGITLLKEAVASSAFHDSGERFDPPKCHPNTRVAVIRRIIDWINGEIDTESFVLWLYGPAGAGKSAIAQTIAELCQKEGLLLATFFFSRTDAMRHNIQRLIATLAYKVMITVPAVRPLIETIVEGDPLIFKTSLETQFNKLILEPLMHLLETGLFQQIRLPPLIIIDGLDECVDTASERVILEIFSRSTQQFELPLKFLITSRPEQIIISTFKSAALKTLTSHLPLNDDYAPDDDIRTFLVAKFEEIRSTHPLSSSIPSSWPSDEDVSRLVKKSSGQFIYASVAIRFSSSLRHDPPDRLSIALGLRPPRRDLPFVELDALYTQILSSVEDTKTVLRILGVSIVLERYEPSLRLEKFLDLEEGCSIGLILGELSSLVQVEWDGARTRIKFYHASFPDFLLSKQRSGDLHIDASLVYSDMTRWCLRAWKDPDTDLYEIRHISDHFLSYCQHAAPTPELQQAFWDLPFFDWTSSMAKLHQGTLMRSEVPPPTGKFSFGYLLFLGAGQTAFADRQELYTHYRALLDQYLIDLTQDHIVPNPLALFLLLGTRHITLSSEWERWYTWGPASMSIFRMVGVGSSDTFQDAITSIFGLAHTDLIWEQNTINLLEFSCSEWSSGDHYKLFHGGQKFPDGYQEFLFDFFGDPQRSEGLRLDSHSYTTLTMSCVRYLCRRSRGPSDPRRQPFAYWAGKSRNTPWVWRRLRQNPHLAAWVRRQWRRWRRIGVQKGSVAWEVMELENGERLLDEEDDAKWEGFKEWAAASADERSLPLRTFSLALHLLPRLLEKAAYSKDLVDALSRGVFHPTSIFFYHRTRRAKEAIEKYLIRVKRE